MGRHEVQRVALEAQPLQGEMQQGLTVKVLSVATLLPLQFKVVRKAELVVKQRAIAVKVKFTVVLNEVSDVIVQVDPEKLQTEPESEAEHVEVPSKSDGNCTAILNREGLAADITKGAVILMERVDEERRARALLGTYSIVSKAAVIEAEVVLSSTQQTFVEELVVVCTVKVLELAYQLFWKLLRVTASEEPTVPVIVIRITVELCWVQAIVKPDVEVEQLRPVAIPMVLGRVRITLSPEQCVRAKETESRQLVTALTVGLFGTIAANVRAVGVVMVTVSPEYKNSMRYPLQQVYSLSESLGLVDEGLIILPTDKISVVEAATALGKQLEKLNTIDDTTLMLQLATVLDPELKETRVTPLVVGKSDGKRSDRVLPAGRAFLFLKMIVQTDVAATVSDEELTDPEAKVTGVA